MDKIGVAEMDRRDLFIAYRDALRRTDYAKVIPSIFGLPLHNWNKWHHDHWPQSSCAACRGEHIIVLLHLKAVQMREEGLL